MPARASRTTAALRRLPRPARCTRAGGAAAAAAFQALSVAQQQVIDFLNTI